MNKLKENDKVKHKDNPCWIAIVIKDLDPMMPVNGMVRVAHTSPLGNVFVSDMPKTSLKLVLDI